MAGHQKPVIKLDQFEGPYDLLLELVHGEKLDVTSVSLSQVTDSFVAIVENGGVSAELLADFLVVASTLLLLKIRRALPSLSPEEEEEIHELTDRIRIYELYRQQAEWMREKWGRKLLPMGFWAPVGERANIPYPAVSAEELFAHFGGLLTHLPKPPTPTAHLTTRGRTLRETLALFEERLSAVQHFVFHEAVAKEVPQDVAVAFLAVLEMARQRLVTLRQSDHFESIRVERI